MKKRHILSLILFLLISIPSEAQKRQHTNEIPPVNEDLRKQSIVYADGLRYYYSDNFTQAEKEFRTVIAQNPKNDAAFFMLSKIRSAQKDYDGAAYYLEEARKIDKNNEWYLIEMATIQDYLRNFKQSARLWEEITKLKPDNEFYLIALAEAYLQQSKYSEAIKTYNRLENLIGNHDELTEVKKSIYLFQNDIKSAVGEYERLITIYPDEIKYHIEIANIYIANNTPDKAYSFLQEALQKDKENGYTNLSLAEYYKIKEKEEEAYKYLLIAFKDPNLPISSKMPEMHNYFNRAYKSKDDKALRRTRQLAEVLTQAHSNATEGWKIIAAIQILRENYSEARVTFEKILSINNTDFSVWSDYVSTLIRLEDYQTIINNAEEIAELFPTNSSFLYDIGYAYLKSNQGEKAIDYFNQASMFTFDPQFAATISASTGDAYFQMGNTTEAVKLWKQAQRKGLNTPELKEKIKKYE